MKKTGIYAGNHPGRSAAVMILFFCLAFSTIYSCAEVFDSSYMAEIGEEYIMSNDLTNRFHWLISEHLFHSAYEESEAEKKIKSYVQVPWSLYPDIRWTGPWNGISIGSQKFSNFGCGVVCLTNLYCTITGQKTTPWQMYEWSQKYSSYRPGGGSGAIDWNQMTDVCRNLGLSTTLQVKPADYAVFQEQMKNTKAMLVLVCRENDDKLWWYTAGHYVVLWEYKADTDSVFVCDPSGLYNRERVPLSYVYQALKTASNYQYMLVE